MKYFVEKEDFIFNTRVYQKICYDNNDIKTKEIEEIPGKIISSQSTSVDVVSGASYTSKGIINAVNDALSKA